jgi:signal transduction histidine kinase
MDSSSLSPAVSPNAEADAVARPISRWSGFFQFQLTFWGLFFVMRALASARIYPEYFWTYMGPRIAIVAAFAGVTTLVHWLVIQFPSWTPKRRLWLTLLLCGLSLYPMHVFERTLTFAVAPDWPSERFLDYLSGFGWVLLAWAAFYFALDHAREVRRQAAALSQAQALAHAAQLKMLRYQLNPHFLFNSLNAISTLVLEGRNKDAEGMLLRLSRFLRHTIDTDPTLLARLGDEAHVQRLYLEMEAVRFGDRLRVQYDVPAQLHDCLVPSLLLQPIVENAIKHGVSQAADGGRIAISAHEAKGRLMLAVENDGPSFANPATPLGVGLRNTQDRLAAIYGEEARLSVSTPPGGGARILFDLPLKR